LLILHPTRAPNPRPKHQPHNHNKHHHFFLTMYKYAVHGRDHYAWQSSPKRIQRSIWGKRFAYRNQGPAISECFLPIPPTPQQFSMGEYQLSSSPVARKEAAMRTRATHRPGYLASRFTLYFQIRVFFTEISTIADQPNPRA
jgi:hypothetical protein